MRRNDLFQLDIGVDVVSMTTHEMPISVKLVYHQ